ncbi:uncharacterized protein SCHCODRAFT_02606812 [Schizophyllum commune H4-8]|uniref:uncharacterized protein n=1 Tax=Schizophyllum commune (strain H4-8 / FGSC 9210) TaxID=578458 RepID=UPI00215E1778|nr:uncharacterized protein SCHCODRAFT_02606812 [Schizophyllum commune H4-8]KAI5900040.1 hypothetical protein SCHCODRAFT_02606812 [Schizophyllum commune H4-8]
MVTGLEDCVSCGHLVGHAFSSYSVCRHPQRYSYLLAYERCRAFSRRPLGVL